MNEKNAGPLNSTADIVINANAVLSPINIRQGKLEIGNSGLDYRPSLGKGYIQIPWRNVKYITVERAFNFWYRGFIVYTTEGQSFEFITNKTKKALMALAGHLKKDQLRLRKGILER